MIRKIAYMYIIIILFNSLVWNGEYIDFKMVKKMIGENEKLKKMEGTLVTWVWFKVPI